MKTLNNTVRTGNDQTRKGDYHIVEQAGRFKVFDAAGRFRLTFATREAAQAYIDGKSSTSSLTDGHVAFQVATSIVVALFLLCYPLVANAQTRWDYCRQISHGTVCVNRVQRVTQITCEWGWQPRFTPVPRCVAMGVQP